MVQKAESIWRWIFIYDMLKAGISGTQGAYIVCLQIFWCSEKTHVNWNSKFIGVIFHVLHISNTLYIGMYFKETPTFMWYIMSSLLSLLLYWASATFLYIRLEKCENQLYESQSDHFYPDLCRIFFGWRHTQPTSSFNGAAAVFLQARLAEAWLHLYPNQAHAARTGGRGWPISG